MGSASEALAEFVISLRATDVPGSVIAAVHRHTLDAAGVALGASTTADALVDLARSWGGAREASVIGHDLRAPAALAAMCNGTLIRTNDFDDTHPESLTHPSSVIFPTMLAVGEETSATGADAVSAYVAGCEVLTRVGAAAPGRFQARGLDATAIAGPFGAAATAGRLWGLSPVEMTNAFGLCASGSSGLRAYLGSGAQTRALHAGWAAFAGIMAADLARRGMVGPVEVFEGPRGLFDALLHGETPDTDRLTHGLGSTWETARMAIKPYAASHVVHAFMDAAIEAGVKWGDIEEIECYVAPGIIDIACEPRAPRLHPESASAARTSLPFAVATAIVGGRDGLEMFGDEARTDRRVLTLAERVHHFPDPSLRFPASFGGRLIVHTRAGRTIEIEHLVNRGHPDLPLSDDEVRDKFLRNARARLDARAARRALKDLAALPSVDSVEDLARSLSVDHD